MNPYPKCKNDKCKNDLTLLTATNLKFSYCSKCETIYCSKPIFSKFGFTLYKTSYMKG